jgi:hypothetical protein
VFVIADSLSNAHTPTAPWFRLCHARRTFMLAVGKHDQCQNRHQTQREGKGGSPNDL